MQLLHARDPTGCLDPKPRRLLFFLGVAPQGMGQVRVLVRILPGSSLGQCHGLDGLQVGSSMFSIQDRTVMYFISSQPCNINPFLTTVESVELRDKRVRKYRDWKPLASPSPGTHQESPSR